MIYMVGVIGDWGVVDRRGEVVKRTESSRDRCEGNERSLPSFWYGQNPQH